jgi:hypothetical protein
LVALGASDSTRPPTIYAAEPVSRIEIYRPVQYQFGGGGVTEARQRQNVWNKEYAMTAVLRFTVQDHPALVGDLLLSVLPAGAMPAPVLPTVIDAHAHVTPASKYVPASVRQKIALLGDNLVIGWSGGLSNARAVIDEIRQKHLKTPFTMEALDQHLDGLNPAVWSNLGLLGFLRDPKGIAQFQRNAKEVSAAHFGTVGLLGSGRADLERYLTGEMQIPHSLDREMNQLDKSLGFALQLTGVSIGLEQLTADQLTKHYGAGYEITSLMGGKFEKMGDVTYIYWQCLAHDGKPRVNKQPIRVYRYAYIDDLLVIRAFSFNPSEPKRDQLHFVCPVYRDPTPEEARWVANPATPTVPRLNAAWLCNYILTAFPDGNMRVLTLICMRAPGEDKWVKITETPVGGDNFHVEVQVHGDFLDLVSKNVEEQLKTMA